MSLRLLLAHPEARIDPSAARGYLESSLLETLVSMEDLEPRAEDCSKVRVQLRAQGHTCSSQDVRLTGFPNASF